jgi:hypothetical protein
VILHVCKLDKFIPPFVKLINEEFGEENHQFWLPDVKKLNDHPLEKADNIFIGKRTITGQLYAYLRLLVMLHRARKVILHGLFNPRVLMVLTFCPWLLSKCYWVLWGGDYLYREHDHRDWKYYLKELFHRFVKKRIKHLITYIPESVEIVKSSYGCRAEWHECLCYTSNVFVDESRHVKPAGKVEKKILVGNSATYTNQHIETFDVISPFIVGDVKVYVPLSYGDETYAQNVIKKGKKVFGDKFYPLLDFIPRSEYQSFLDDIDIVVFNHNRHQAMGTIINILGLGKTLYMNSRVASWPFLKRLGLDIYCIDGFEDLEVKADAEKNREIIKNYFSIDNLKRQWGDIFEQ